MIRLAVLGDLTTIQACADAAYGIYVDMIGRKPAPMVADFAVLIARDVVWVCDGGFIVMFPDGDALHVENIAVHPEAQGNGVGRALMGFAETHARDLGLHRIELYTNAKMTGPRRLYPRLGFMQTDHRFEDGFDRVYFAKDLTK